MLDLHHGCPKERISIIDTIAYIPHVQLRLLHLFFNLHSSINRTCMDAPGDASCCSSTWRSSSRAGRPFEMNLTGKAEGGEGQNASPV